MTRKQLLFLFLLLAPNSLLAEVIVTDNRVRFGFQELTLPGNEKLGLLGLGFLIDRRLNDRTTFYYGLGVYSAVTGIRGGFFTGGVELGIDYKIGRLVLDGGVFVGGGGGGAAPQGGGFMIRPHVGALYDFGRFRLGIEYSKVKFPNGNIDSDQLGIIAEIPLQNVFVRGQPDKIAGRNIVMASVYISTVAQHYAPSSSAVLAKGVQSMNLAGIELGRFFSDRAYYFLETSAAIRGRADGYAELLGGVGYRYPLGKRVALKARAAVGAGGGGAIDTGGGFIYKASVGADVSLTRHFAIGIEYGFFDAPDGSFQAEMARVTLRYALKMAAASGYGEPLTDTRTTDIGKWAIRMSYATYRDDPTLRKTPLQRGGVDLIAMKIDRDLTRNIYITGQAAVAYEGNAGGYATGLLGVGYKRMLGDRLEIRAELLAGAGGGGAINTQGGGILQPMIGFTYKITRNLDFALMAGKLRGMKGKLDTEVVDVGLIYRFNTLESR